jgi:hypothetical protein
VRRPVRQRSPAVTRALVILRQRAGDHPVKRAEVRPDRGDKGRRLAGVLPHQLRLIGALEREPAGEHLERGHAEGIDVRLRGDGRPRQEPSLLRRHVLRRAHRDRLARIIAWRGEAKVHEHGAGGVVLDDDVGGLDVPVDEPRGVHGADAVRDLRQDLQRPVHRDRRVVLLVLGDDRPQAPPVDVLHREEVRPLVRPEGVDLDDVLAADRGERLRLLLEARSGSRVAGPGGGDHLERHLAIEPGVARQVDDTHAAASEL